MEIGPDGSIYLLEYGKGWFTKNTEAALEELITYRAIVRLKLIGLK